MTKCRVCNCDLGELPMCFGSSSPASSIVPPDEYNSRVEENADQCIIDDQHYFVRGHIELPIKGSKDVFVWSVWVSLSPESFEDMSEHWDQKGREYRDPYFGWLSTSLPCYPDTLHMKTSVQSMAVGEVPLITLEPSEHPLSIEQALGVSLDRVHEIVHQVLSH